MLKNTAHPLIASVCVCLLVLTFFISTTNAQGPPLTTLVVADTSPLGFNGWYVGAVEVNMTAQPAAEIAFITFWLDLASPVTRFGSTATQTFFQQGEHLLSYFATTTGGVEENPIKQFAFKLDSQAPTNWRNFTAERRGNDHTFALFIDVDDKTSGIDTNSGQYQYSVDGGVTWGYHNSLTNCASSWVTDGWKSIDDDDVDPNTPGSKTVTLTTPAIDFCNSNWEVTKMIRFRISDMAGNTSTRERALFAAWVKVTLGDVYAQGQIDMSTGDNTADFLVASGLSPIINFVSGADWLVSPYPMSPTIMQGYANLYNKAGSPTTSLPAGKLPTTSGHYFVGGDLTIDSGVFPANFSTATNFASVIFVNGDIEIKESFIIDPTAALIFVATGEIRVNKRVDEIAGFYITDGIFNSSNDGNQGDELVIYGGVAAAGGFDLTTRAKRGPSGETTPSEEFVLQPAYFLNQNLLRLMGSGSLSWQEVIP